MRGVAKRIGRSHSSLVREIKKNTKFGRKYLPCLAQKRAERVGNKQRAKAPLKDPEIFLYVREHLRKPFFWTPQMIAGRIGRDLKGASLCPETIYSYIYSRPVKRDRLWEYLPSGRKRRRKKTGRKIHRRGRVPEAISIDLRPKVIGRRQRPGDWETDNVEGIRSSKPALSVCVERLSRKVILTRVVNQTAGVKTQALAQRLKPLPEGLRLSITQDNGRENYGHRKTKQALGTQMYFCHAYHAWEKGAVENRNRVIRRFFPKGTDFSQVSQEVIQKVEDIINSMPMKCLGHLTPYEKMNQLLSKLKSKKIY